MRLGCEATAIDINPVAWFILKCTLEYPQRLAGQTRPLPDFAYRSPEFMESYFKGTGKLTKKQLARKLQALQEAQMELPGSPELAGRSQPPEADLAWHVRAWGWWVLQRAKADLERFYPVVDGKPTVAYLWARTVKCKNCRATIPLLKTRWLAKKDNKRVLLTMEPNADRTGVTFGIQTDVPQGEGGAARRKAHDKQLGAGTMSRSGVTCPCCSVVITMEDIRLEGQTGRLGAVMTAVIVDGLKGKEYRLPLEAEIQLAAEAEQELSRTFSEVPFGLPDEPLPGKEALGIRIPLYGFNQWYKLFTPRQLLALGTFLKHIRAASLAMQEKTYPSEWTESISSYLATSLSRLVDYSSILCIWALGEVLCHTFTRYALPIVWDFIEGNPISETTGNFAGAVDWVTKVVDHLMIAQRKQPAPLLQNTSVNQSSLEQYDAIVTDPPYYDAIPYSDLMDFFYVWLHRTLNGLSAEIDAAFSESLAPKWDHDKNDGELIDDASRFDGDGEESKARYEEGMLRAFQVCHEALRCEGRLVVVFANKQPDAWETLVSALIRAGFVVDGSWPIQTERSSRAVAHSSAALSASIWIVCKKRPITTRPGWDNRVLEEMRAKITQRLRDFWDAGIRGPDFVWAATGPALEAYSKYPAVKKANEPGQLMTVSEFLGHVRRMVVDFVVGRVLSADGEAQVSDLDNATVYYLLHRYDFKMDDAPSGACILYAISCGLTDSALVDRFDLLTRSGGASTEPDDDETEDEDDEAEAGDGGGSKVRLKAWHQRRRRNMGYDGANGQPAPLIDQVHRLMHLWKAGNVADVDDYMDERGLRRNALFKQVLQALIELSPAGSEERSLLESISNHLAALGVARERPEKPQQLRLFEDL